METRCHGQSLLKLEQLLWVEKLRGERLRMGSWTAGKLLETFKVFRTKSPIFLESANYRYETGIDPGQYRYLLGGVAHRKNDVLRGQCDRPCLPHSAAHWFARLHHALQKPDIYARVNAGETGQDRVQRHTQGLCSAA